MWIALDNGLTGATVVSLWWMKSVDETCSCLTFTPKVVADTVMPRLAHLWFRYQQPEAAAVMLRMARLIMWIASVLIARA